VSSWYDAWADRYDERSTGAAADVPFYVGLARDADGPLVELAVGTGRVAIPVARATGRRVIGIDASPAMLTQARERAVEAGVDLDLREGDIRELDLEEPAALIYSVSPHRFDPTAASPGMRSRSTITSRPRPTAGTSTRLRACLCRTRSTTASARTGST
jgi:SAM-dependent methyltransferase